jgi:ammonia channel protein AmtB
LYLKPFFYFSRIDDAVGATSVHGFGGLWGILAVGLFASVDTLENKYCLYDGLFHGNEMSHYL